MKSFFTHPLLHFVLAGVALYFLVGKPDRSATDTGDRSREIVITEGRIENLVTIFQKTWQRPPTASEMQGLIHDFVQEEIYYREAIALGLDRDDTVIRRRMRQKIEFLTQDLATPEAPDDEVLAAYLDENADAYRKESRYSLRQVYLDPGKYSGQIEARARELIARLEARPESEWTGETLAELGDGLQLLRNRHDDQTESNLARDFGRDFAAALDDLPEGEWTGPVRSGYGFHVIRIDAKEPGRPAELAEVREAVLRDWSTRQREEANTRLYESLFHRYTISLESEDGTRRVMNRPGESAEKEKAEAQVSPGQNSTEGADE